MALRIYAISIALFGGNTEPSCQITDLSPRGQEIVSILVIVERELTVSTNYVRWKLGKTIKRMEFSTVQIEFRGA